MFIFNEVVNILTIFILAYTIVRIKKRNIANANGLIYTMSAFIFLTLVDIINTFFIKNPTLDLSVVILKLPLVVILVFYFIKLRKKGSL
ncbi:MAG: hypothetical protein Q3988_03590 [Gemella sp.]|nr:hypothetical protein [Gemella sp.]